MIALLTGTVALLGDGHAVIDVRGVGYLAHCSARTLAGLSLGAPARLHVETQVREDAISLYGFTAPIERDWFRLLQTVQGVGARVALAILSILEPDRLARAIVAQDKAALARADGVGPKLAARLTAELKDKAPALALSAAARQAPALEPPPAIESEPEEPAPAPRRRAAAKAAPAAKPNLIPDCVSALENLGYRREEAFSAALRVSERLGGTGGEDLATLIRETLKELAPA